MPRNPFDIIQTADHKIQACGPSTGHFVKTVALCESAQIADYLLHGAQAKDTLYRLGDDLIRLRNSIRNARGAIESNQVVDKDVHGTLSRALDQLEKSIVDVAESVK